MNTLFKCPSCGWEEDVSKYFYKCPRCGEAIDVLYDEPTISPKMLKKEGYGVTRYKEILPPLSKYISLGEGSNPVIYDDDMKTYFVLEHLNPSGSFKDRGAAFTVSYLASYHSDLRELVEDSSGNAGIAFTLYGRFAGFNVHIFVPEDAPKGKISYIRLLGGIIHKTDTRNEASVKALDYSRNRLYVGHIYNPFFILGIETLAYDLYRILNDVDHIFIPFGSGTLFLGFYRGLKRLRGSDIVTKDPMFHIIEAAGYEKLSRTKASEKSRYIDGIKVTFIPRMREMKNILHGITWRNHVINDREAISALRQLIEKGFIVEPTSAASYSALLKLREYGDIKRGEKSLIILTGSALKMINDILEMFKKFNFR